MIEASKARDGEALGLLLRSCAAANAREKNGSTALLNAIALQAHRDVDTLLKHEVDRRAAMRDDVNTAKRLLANGAPPDESDGSATRLCSGPPTRTVLIPRWSTCS